MLGGEFKKGIEAFVEDKGERAVMCILREAVKAADTVEGSRKVQAMDVWCAEFMHGASPCTK